MRASAMKIYIPIVFSDALWALAVVVLAAFVTHFSLSAAGMPAPEWVLRSVAFGVYAGWVWGYVMGSRPMGPS